MGAGSKQALQFFEDMRRSCVEPDEAAFLAVLMACSHSGKVERGLQLFNNMRFEYKIKPTVKRYTCMVDLFGRAGELGQALAFIRAIPVEQDFLIWGALFSACRPDKNVELAELAANKLLNLSPVHHGSYVFLSNMYARAGRWEDVEKVRINMKDKGVEKSPGWSFTEVEGKTNHFVAGDRPRTATREIYGKLEEIEIHAGQKGYEPNTDWVLHDIEAEDKEDSLGCHSEKLAIAVGLLRVSGGVQIKIVKNLSVGGLPFMDEDCEQIVLEGDYTPRYEAISSI